MQRAFLVLVLSSMCPIGCMFTPFGLENEVKQKVLLCKQRELTVEVQEEPINNFELLQKNKIHY